MSLLSRRTFMANAAAAASAVAFPGPARAALANDEITLGFISCGGRANELMSAFEKVSGTRVGGLCDPDESRLGKTRLRYPKARSVADLRQLLDDDAIDAVVIATCNHWHCLAAIWAMQAGKDVYVEKPLSHNQWEGQQTVNAARKYARVCQVGTQQRSDPMQAEIKSFLHDQKALGPMISARVNRYGVRGPIGKRTTPLPIDSSVNYDLWLGPAEDRPIFRDNLQYDWHWDWNTGSGEMGNWGVHVLDDLRNIVFRDQVTLPRRILGGGGRVAWNDAGETPNVHFVYFDTGVIPVVIGLTNLPAAPDQKGSPDRPGPASGYVVYCEGGRFEGQRGSGTAYDNEGKPIRRFRGNSGMGHHQQNFIDCVRSRDASKLNTEVQVGHHSTGWCNLANIACRVGLPFSSAAAGVVTADQGIWRGLLSEMESHLRAHSIPLTGDPLRLSQILTLDVDRELFIGDHADQANALLRRTCRSGFDVPEITV